MKLSILPLIVVTVCTAAFSSARSAETEADIAWNKVESAMNSIKKPAKPPGSREEAMANFKTGLAATDEAGKEFLDQYPADPRRWKLQLFQAMTAGARQQLGLPAKGDLKLILAEILKSTDADAEIKGEASAITLLDGAEEVEEGKTTSADWIKNAETHLKAYPECKFNPMIAGKVSSMKTLADLKTKPLDLKFVSVNGQEVDLSKMSGKVVLIDFWATWCGPCVKDIPNVLKSYEKFHGKGFEIIGISLDSDKAKLESFTKDKGMTWVQYFDGKGWKNEISSRFGINSIPAMWLVNKKGIVVSTDARGKLDELVEKYLAE
ncbi:MAG: TlpA family protein disulfide reductase [Verrucomicrobia bacterium]|nr:TlpA family protein disulfide reductase [Verrucomicrobiota bacterium]